MLSYLFPFYFSKFFQKVYSVCEKLKKIDAYYFLMKKIKNNFLIIFFF